MGHVGLLWTGMSIYDDIGVNRPAFGGTVPHFHQMSRVPRNETDVPHFFKMVVIIFFFC